MAFAAELPVAKAAFVAAAIAAEHLALAVEGAVFEVTDPYIALGVLVTSAAFEAVVLELADVLLAFDAVVGAGSRASRRRSGH